MKNGGWGAQGVAAASCRNVLSEGVVLKSITSVTGGLGC